MKVRRHSQAREDTHIDLAPMLDFFLNLLIFFIISAAFVSESGLKINRPSAATAVKLDNSAIFIGISASGEIFVDRGRVDIRLLRATIERLRAQKPKSPVVIQADRDARAGLVVEAMDQARLAGAIDVAISAAPVSTP
ncbi:biopolymer transporter ExbD [uncultured Nevskia sp.]|uniref:ExbD/TolR family protein n=1 Tax=uncultured Nevskia sp. TaxID=228950 RepID=UPI0025CC0668|nr:biopolymer transporter ExbD [uncultured Nevskia sp.]